MYLLFGYTLKCKSYFSETQMQFNVCNEKSAMNKGDSMILSMHSWVPSLLTLSAERCFPNIAARIDCLCANVVRVEAHTVRVNSR